MDEEKGTASEVVSSNNTQVSFAHVQLYVDRLEQLEVYKELENTLNEFGGKVKSEGDSSLQRQQALWCEVSGTSTPPAHFVPHNRDIVTQLLVGFGFRVTRASHPNKCGTRSVLVTSRDPKGVQFIVTAPTESVDAEEEGSGLLSRAKCRRFMDSHNGQMGIGVLAFAVDSVEPIKNRYEKLHPALIDSYQELASSKAKVLEVFAYYKQHNGNSEKKTADPGTILRFVESPNDELLYSSTGLDEVDASFDDRSYAAYCDHWVSNVFSRTEFLDTLKDTLDFTPKVDFNAGVVAAGEAQIESTVTGNTSEFVTADKNEALRDQSQVYLPINNALSSVGHVHGFLKDLGQGVQHIASRVENLVDFVQQANDNRKITGEGFSFLRIPRSYYGVLSLNEFEEIHLRCGRHILDALTAGKVVMNDGAVDLDVTRSEIDRMLTTTLNGASLDEYIEKKDQILDRICLSRYKNLYSLLGDHVSEQTYLATVRNQILVDIQGEDLLYQIFTCNILQRKTGDEAPFLEFIQRVCSECSDENVCTQKVRPGCGGFGIRNFLTLFLSIEVSKAMQEASDARNADDSEREQYAQAMIEYFTSQLNESNPILTEISDAMTEEGHCQEMLASLKEKDDRALEAEWEWKRKEAAKQKMEGNAKLMECSSRYNQKMKAIRQARFQ